MLSFLYFDGFKVKDNRSPGIAGIIFDAPTRRSIRTTRTPSSPLHGLWKLADDRIISPICSCPPNTRITTPGSSSRRKVGWGCQSGRDLIAARSYGSSPELEHPSADDASTSTHSFLTALGAAHDLKYGIGWRRVNATTGTLWPGNGILALEQTPTTSFAQVFREGSGTTARPTSTSTSATPSRKIRATIDLGLRYDCQWAARCRA